MATPSLRHSKRQQAGVAAIFAAVSLVALLSALALAVDIGRLYSAQRDLQKWADLAAIDATRVMSGCFIDGAQRGNAEAEVTASLLRNGSPPGTRPTVQLGRKVSVNGTLEFIAGNGVALNDSVQVQLTRQSPARILPLISGESSRSLVAIAAAFGGFGAYLEPPSPLSSADPTSIGSTLGQQLGGPGGSNLNIDPAALRASGDTTIKIGDLIEVSQQAGADGSELSEEQTTRGLLNRIADLLRAAGNSALATLVQTLADATDAGAKVIPAELLGIPLGTPRALYENAQVGVDTLISSLAALASGGLNIDLPITLPPPLGDQVGHVTIQQPGTAGLSTSSSTKTSTSTDNTSISSAGGTVQLGLSLIEPISGKPLSVPVTVTQQAANSRLNAVSCARRGQAQAQALYDVDGGGINVSLGNSEQSSASGVEILKLPILGNNIVLRAQASDQSIGGRPQSLCFEGPRFPTSTQCDGSPAHSGAASPAEIAEAVKQLGSSVKISVEGLPTGPAGVAARAALAPVLDSVNQLLPGLLDALGNNIVPVLSQANLPNGGMAWKMTSLEEKQPVVFIR